MNYYRVMIRSILLFIGMLLCNASLYAQNNQKITLQENQITLKEALKKIGEQGKFSIAYNESLLPTNRKVDVNIKNTSVESALKSVLKDSGLTFSIKDGFISLHIIQSENKIKKQISGIVYDSEGEPLIGVNVKVKNTANGTITNFDGEFDLTVNTNDLLVFSYVGYSPKEVRAGSQNRYTVTLSEDSELLDEVVVTALGIKRSQKALSYNVQEVKSDELLKNKDANFINALSGKVAGVTINSSSSGVGGATKVVMRGTKSIEQSSNALYVIDGVPMFNFTSKGSTEFESQGTSESIADINPEDIASLTVLTGAAAAALYGSEAANGAIVVTTKQGQAGKTHVTFSSNTEFISPFVMPKFQNTYGTSDAYKSWGDKLISEERMSYSPRSNYFQTGVVGTETASISMGNDKNQTYVSVGSVNSRGVTPNNKYERYNFTARNTTSLFNDRVQLDLGGSSIQQKDLNMTNQGVYNNPLASAYLFPRGNDWKDIQMFERFNGSRKIYEQYWPSGQGTYVLQNPYWINYRNRRQNNKTRYMYNIGVKVDVFDWLNVAARFRRDRTNNTFTEKFNASTVTLLTEGSPNGLYGINQTKDIQTYADVLVSMNKQFDNSLSLSLNLGGSTNDMRSDALIVRGPIAYGVKIADGVYENTGIPNVFNVKQLSDSKTIRDQDGWREKINSLFATAEIGFKGAYYLTLTGRNDWPSQLAGPKSVNKSFFYPSVGVSLVLSEIFNLPKEVSYLKVRASYASVGLPFARYRANPTYAWDNNAKVWVPKTEYPMYNLKPERTDSWEFGLTTRFLSNFNLDFSFYNTETSNQTFDPGISASSGWSKVYIQTGNVRNRGIELSLGYSNTWRDFSWSSNYTLSMNRNKIIDLADNAINPITGEKLSISHLDVGGIDQARFILTKGGGLGDLYSTSDLVRDNMNQVYVDENENIQAEKINNFKDYIKLGSVFAKANMAWRNDLSYKGLNLGFMIAARLGGVVYSKTQAALDYYGVSKQTAQARDFGGVLINNNQDLIAADKWFNTVGSSDGVPQYYTYSATNVRLQELSLGYNLPKKWFNNVVDASITLVGRNLWMMYCKAPFDPENIASTGNYYQGIDYFMMPSTRNFGVNLKLKF